MPNIFLISSNLKLSSSKNKIIIYNKNENLKVKLPDVKNIFILNNQQVNLGLIDYLRERKINIFSIDGFGNLKNIFLYKKRTEPFLFKNPIKVSQFIIEKEIYSINSFILKSRMPFKKNYSSNYLRSVFYSFTKNPTLEDFRFSHHINLNELKSIIQYEFPIFNRMNNSKDPQNITVNYFHSLMFCFLYSWFNSKGIDVFKSKNLFFEKNNENYPGFLKAIFTQFRIRTTVTGLHTYRNLLVKFQDFSTDGEITQSGKLIISKVFTERFIHNLGTHKKLENFWEDIKINDENV